MTYGKIYKKYTIFNVVDNDHICTFKNQSKNKLIFILNLLSKNMKTKRRVHLEKQHQNCM